MAENERGFFGIGNQWIWIVIIILVILLIFPGIFGGVGGVGGCFGGGPGYYKE
jgi:hypothetical protein